MRRKKNRLIIKLILVALVGGGVWFFGRGYLSTHSLARPEIGSLASDRGSRLVEELVNLSEKVKGSFDRIRKQDPPDDDRGDALVVARIGVLSDSHGASRSIERSLQQMQDADVGLVLHLGDFTAGGEDYHFAQARALLDESEIAYQVLPGDHDFNWVPEHSRRNYEAVFGPAYDRVYNLTDTLSLILFDNSVDEADVASKIGWLEAQLQETRERPQTVIFFSPRPLYSPYFADKADPRGERIMQILADAGVEYAIAGNTHVFAAYRDPAENLDLITVGAVGEYKNPLPQWVLVEIYGNGEIKFSPKPLVEF